MTQVFWPVLPTQKIQMELEDLGNSFSRFSLSNFSCSGHFEGKSAHGSLFLFNSSAREREKIEEEEEGEKRNKEGNLKKKLANDKIFRSKENELPESKMGCCRIRRNHGVLVIKPCLASTPSLCILSLFFTELLPKQNVLIYIPIF